MIDVSEITSFTGHVSVLDQKTIALHSDRFYIIKQNQFSSWHVLHQSDLAPVGNAPVIKGPDGLVAYCAVTEAGRELNIMDSLTGHSLYRQFQNNQSAKILNFLSSERVLVAYEREICVLNLRTLQKDEIKVFDVEFSFDTVDNGVLNAYAISANEFSISQRCFRFGQSGS